MDPTTSSPDPKAIVIRFLQALEAQDHDTVAELLAPDVRYTNVSLPTLTGNRLVSGLIRQALRPGTGFEVKNHNIAVDGDTVMTERTDILKLGPLHIGFWVCGTFRVHNGRIVLWRDYFDWWNITKGTARGLAGIALPGLRPTLADIRHPGAQA
ncbi:MAG: limonene-1,2-epoxide hydrolase family protein [Marinobacter sp.]|uniref:limonene-1,2-epoxide hydrolase family protein n=1 Tax=Marinobacter sp. TaxID=50741 RepID=UPI00299D5854|nr:limonene-1,2-epoxide hydrolase family protein [Marinobacter sp.]MDX1756178.1 limonene-1,2-epoxide hydrolase family protein [Marinobacter sp.]